MKPAVFYTLADEKNMEYALKMQNSLKKFHPDIPHIIYSDKDFWFTEDPKRLYRMYAVFGEELSKQYDLVMQIDADSIVTGSLDHIINDTTYEIGGVLNNNTIDPQISIFCIPPEYYINAGFLAVRSQRFWSWWNKLNYTPYFDNMQFVEQDMLNLIFHLGDLKTKIFDMSENWHGLIHKGLWGQFEMEGDNIVLPENLEQEHIMREKKYIKIIHWAGGNVPKLNYQISFKPEVVKRLNYLVGDTK